MQSSTSESERPRPCGMKSLDDRSLHTNMPSIETTRVACICISFLYENKQQIKADMFSTKEQITWQNKWTAETQRFQKDDSEGIARNRCAQRKAMKMENQNNF
mmetsp:Transcript_16084/g.30920  ORF Transcript_16084/g.30920 Transcript_16084/m.30920 type:complete len:103 (-) Transcript_16084:129-437(-)